MNNFINIWRTMRNLINLVSIIFRHFGGKTYIYNFLRRMRIKYILGRSWEKEKLVISLFVTFVGFIFEPSITYATSIETVNDLCKAAKPYQKDNIRFTKKMIKILPEEPLIGGLVFGSILVLGVILTYIGTAPFWGLLSSY